MPLLSLLLTSGNDQKGMLGYTQRVLKLRFLWKALEMSGMDREAMLTCWTPVSSLLVQAARLIPCMKIEMSEC